MILRLSIVPRYFDIFARSRPKTLQAARRRPPHHLGKTSQNFRATGFEPRLLPFAPGPLPIVFHSALRPLRDCRAKHHDRGSPMNFSFQELIGNVRPKVRNWVMSRNSNRVYTVCYVHCLLRAKLRLLRAKLRLGTQRRRRFWRARSMQKNKSGRRRCCQSGCAGFFETVTRQCFGCPTA
jgi:hypothetical protein